LSPSTLFVKLNDRWNAEPNAPDARATVEGRDVILDFFLNPWKFPRFREEQRARLRFRGTWRYRLGSTNDEGWYRGQCRFSAIAPAWGEFYEVRGDLRLDECPNDWKVVGPIEGRPLRHFLFYLRDETFVCEWRRPSRAPSTARQRLAVSTWSFSLLASWRRGELLERATSSRWTLGGRAAHSV
jgi:hypothetical protein